MLRSGHSQHDALVGLQAQVVGIAIHGGTLAAHSDGLTGYCGDSADPVAVSVMPHWVKSCPRMN